MTTRPTPRRNDLCPCGSGQRFKHCCGRAKPAIHRFPVQPMTMMMTPEVARSLCPAGGGDGLVDRHGVLTIPGFLTRAQCDRLIALSETQPSEQGQVLRADESDPGTLIRQDADTRVTSIIKTFGIADDIVPLIGRAFFDWVEPHYGTRIEWFEFPDILKYLPGGHYGTHNDSERWDQETGEWRLHEDRQYSLLIYLNEGFTGGALRFEELGLTIQPETGMLVAFPSDHRYAHTALPVESGTRYAIVSWAAAVGAPRVHEGASLGVVYLAPEYIPPRLRRLA